MKVRTIRLLKELLSVSYPLSPKKLSNDFNVSTRTIQNLVIEANEYLESLKINEIENIRNKGLYLELNAKSKNKLLNNIYSDGYFYFEKEEREFDLILCIGFSDQPVFLNKKAEEYMVSKSTIDEDMRNIRKRTNEYNIQIVSNGKNGVIFKGSERSIRTMLLDIINCEINTFELILDNKTSFSIHLNIFYKYIEKNSIYEAINAVNNIFKNISDELYKKNIVLFTIIWIYRLKNNNSIGDINWSKQEKVLNEKNIEIYINLIIKTFDLEVSQLENNYLEFILNSLVSNSMGYSQEWVQAQIITISLIDYVEDKTSIPFHKEDESLYESLYKHIYFMLLRIKSEVQIYNPIIHSLKKTYPLIYNTVSNFAQIIEKKIGKKISDGEVSFLVIHFSTIYTLLREENELTYKCAVICNHGIATSNLLAANLRRSFPEIEIIAILGTNELKILKKLDVDLVFSTFPLSDIHLPNIVIDPLLNHESKLVVKDFLFQNNNLGRIKVSDKNYDQLFDDVLGILEKSNVVDFNMYKQLNNVFRNNGFQINKKEYQPMLKDKLSDRNIIINGDAKDWKDAIKLVSVPLLEQNIIEEKYVDAMINSIEVNGPYIVIGKHLALAHARPEEGVKQLGVSVATLSTPVEFGNDLMDPVKIIFCLAAPNSYSHLNIMKELVYLIQDENRLEKLINCESVKDFKKILFKD